MADLIERYIHQVGWYLPKRDRTEVKAELRSQIHDQLEDRYGNDPTQDEIAAVLADLGDPRRFALAYNPNQYFVGAELYPTMIGVLRYGWLTIPTMIIFLHVFGALTASTPPVIPDLLLAVVLTTLQFTLMFSGAVMLIFALIQRFNEVSRQKQPLFNPLDLPKVDDPATVDRYEVIFGAVAGAFFSVLLLHFLQAGGIPINLSVNPATVIPVPQGWIWVLLGVVMLIIITNLIALWRNQWTIPQTILEMVTETMGVIGLYFVIYLPLNEHLLATTPSFANLPLSAHYAVIFAILTALMTLNGQALRLAKLWSYQSEAGLQGDKLSNP